jgi:hypothetical protein
MSRKWEDEPDQRVRERVKVFCPRLPRIDHSLDPLMAEYLGDRRLELDLAIDNLWYPSCTAGDHHPRIVIPASSKIPGNVFWQARFMGEGVKPKYQSPHAARGDAVVVVWPSQKGITHSAIVEGPMDALAAAGTGRMGVALMGVTPPDESLALTAALVRGTICVLVADTDAIPEMTRVYEYLCQRVPLVMVSPFPCKDLAEAMPDEREAILCQAT